MSFGALADLDNIVDEKICQNNEHMVEKVDNEPRIINDEYTDKLLFDSNTSDYSKLEKLSLSQHNVTVKNESHDPNDGGDNKKCTTDSTLQKKDLG